MSGNEATTSSLEKKELGERQSTVFFARASEIIRHFSQPFLSHSLSPLRCLRAPLRCLRASPQPPASTEHVQKTNYDRRHYASTSLLKYSTRCDTDLTFWRGSNDDAVAARCEGGDVCDGMMGDSDSISEDKAGEDAAKSVRNVQLCPWYDSVQGAVVFSAVDEL